jgi:hypothetical protein
MKAGAVFLAPALVVLGIPARPAAFDHSAWDALLREHVENGSVDYDAFQASPEFASYLEALDDADLGSLDGPERLALWINAYNAYTIQLINVHGERRSIRDINKTLGILEGKGPWREPIAKVGGRTLTLDDVEHAIIRKEFDEPRIHFALVCAAVGCPPLRSEAYTGERLESQLDDQARIFVRESPSLNRVDVRNGTVYASPIYAEWYREDFGGTNASIGRFLAAYYPDGPERKLLESGRFKLVPTAYDWTLNSRAKHPSKKP